MNVAGPALPVAFFRTQMAVNATTSATAGTFGTLTFATVNESFANGILDRPNTNVIRALLPGYYEISAFVGHFNNGNANPRSLQSRLLLNGATPVPGSLIVSNANNTLDTAAGSLIHIPIIQLAANDTIEVQAAPLQATSHTVLAIYTKFSMRLVRLI